MCLFLSEVNLVSVHFDWPIVHFQKMCEAQLIRGCFSFSQPLWAGFFFHFPSPLPTHFSQANMVANLRSRAPKCLTFDICSLPRKNKEKTTKPQGIVHIGIILLTLLSYGCELILP